MTKHNIKTIDVHELKRRMDQQDNLCLIDVREPQEWNVLRIPGAVLIPKDEITAHIGTRTTDKNEPIYLHCRSGVRSLYAAECLMDIGYKEVYSIDGGIMEWAMHGYPVEE